MKQPVGPKSVTLEEWRALLEATAGSFPDFPLREDWAVPGYDTLPSEPEHEPQPGIDLAQHVCRQCADVLGQQ